MSKFLLRICAFLTFLSIGPLLVSCGGGGGSSSGDSAAIWYRPSAATTWNIQLQTDSVLVQRELENFTV